MKHIAIAVLLLLLGCDGKEDIPRQSPLQFFEKSVSVMSSVGDQPGQISVPIDSEGNPLGYLEYLPNGFTTRTDWPIILYWNGQNAGAGNGHSDLVKLTSQGLPMLIDEGHDFPAIIISPMTEYKAWKYLDVKPFIDYVRYKYQLNGRVDQLYLTGFSGGAGLSFRYLMKYPDDIAASVLVAPAIPYPSEWQGDLGIEKVPTWFVHNSGDPVISVSRSEEWHSTCLTNGWVSELTVLDDPSHYAWRAAYLDLQAIAWLISH